MFLSIRALYNNWSIKTKLTFFIILVSSAVSYVTYELTHATLHTSLSREENDFIYERLHTLRSLIGEKPDYLAIIQQDIEWEGKNVPFPYYYLRFIDETGRVLIETPGMDKTIPMQWVPAPPSAADADHHDVVRKAPNGRYFLVMADSMVPPHGAAKSLTIQIALDVTSELTIDSANHNRLFILAIVRAFLFAGIIIIIIRKLFGPLDTLVRFSEQVSVTNISERTDPEMWPKEARRLGIAFNGMLDRLEDALSRLSHCASNMAHEMRTPIHNFMGEAEIVLSQERTPEEYRKVLESGVEECERLSRLINGLLFLARAENPANAIQHELFDPVAEIHELHSFFTPQMEEKGAEFSCHGDRLLSGDPLLFRRAMSNLMANALNYSPHGVKIDIAVTTAGDGATEVVVSDTGYGIEAEHLSRIFDRFYRADRSHSNYPEGSGLGLSIVKAIMDLHGGTVAIESKPGVGTKVILRFPLHRQAEIKGSHRSPS